MLKLNHQRGYRKFVNGRDEALETLLRNSRLRISELTAETFRRVLEHIQIKYNSIMHTGSRMEMDRLEQQIAHTFEHLSFQIWMEMIDLRKKAYMLSFAGEAQAIAQTTARTAKLALSKNQIDEKAMVDKLASGISPMRSFNLKFSKMRRDIISRLEYSLAFGEPVDKALGRVWMTFPKQAALPKKKVLKTVKLEEAKKPAFSAFDQNDSVEISVGTQKPVHGFEWDQETWDRMIDDLGSEHVFTDRSPEAYLDITNPFNDLKVKNNIPNEDKIYAWEIENEVVHDFVEQVREGQVDAAKKNGINDFVWIAILDDRTDECCEWRSGLLTSEIEARLKTDKKDDPCREIVPPAHFNCRCTLAPASSDLEAVDNTDTEREFDSWLNER